MNEIALIKLERAPLTAGEISEWLSVEKGPNHYRPLSLDRRGLFSFDVHSVGGFAGWSGSSSVERSLSVSIESDDFMFFVEHETYYNVATGGIQHTIAPGSGLLTSADRYSSLNIGEGSMAEGFCVPRKAVLTALADSFERATPASFEFTPLHDLTSGPAARMLKLMRFFRDDICGDQSLIASPIALASFQEMFCLLMVQNLRHTLTNFNSPVHSIAPRQIKRAIEFARTNAAQPITISDMAAAAGVSVRGLQSNFRRFLNATPMEYLRRLRLEGARHEIKAADLSSTVTDIARRWGFLHLGRFSQEYHAAFGVMPSSDLADSRRKFMTK
ncbi:AraC family transcriptional regulator [Rhizobium leguminosarum]|uniref:AraC family transcriptional regulator n=1 Tax=Rhizobium leguminosarum TaxID=384 RepID=UPI00103254B9|nr:AraC family transcriptional regulator [Rhizobium leguminosarum]TAU73768.1 AraC family transcriptional regulator [Rhizobium leguminosarum]TAX03326.1 AraC family transcriptional regulator [Rhizobium leguminosarum]TAX24038.1 AraC family transcriptional regulator [Rhizobium leguminosarum]TAY05726.1 AraC family transcriptional regulator [Rhizobium leguminosarum]TAZ03529.1 AraC family transcriptional regulator [Rhizobium leguminosarum]